MGKIEVNINTMAPGWSVIVTFSDPIAVGNVQVFNARYTEISTDSKTILFVSKTSHNVWDNIQIKFYLFTRLGFIP